MDEKQELLMANNEDGKPETRFSLKDIIGRVTFVEIIFNFSCVLLFERTMVRWDEDVTE